MIDEYVNVLNRYLLHCWIFCGIAVLICTVWIIVELKRKTFDKNSLLLVFIGGVFLFIGLWHTVDVRLDIKQNSIETVYFDNANYDADVSDSSGDFLAFAQRVTVRDVDGQVLELFCIRNIFPYEAEKGKLVYATHTELILEYDDNT